MSDLFDALRPGTRVVVRYRLDGPDGRLSDALGPLLWVRGEGAERSICVRTKRGEVRIATSLITHAKPVPPPPARRASRSD
ncbi:MAG: hypothetical protein LBE25_14530 [Arthrobacter sp.]|jgi:hypothetical protein|nr:hypothetical protein [Arthrobacter sp.]